MDKNTLTGVLLMGAVILGFMWLNKPSEEEMARQRQQAEQLARQAESQATAPVLAIDSISASEKSRIASTIKQFGVLDSLTGTCTLSVADATLTLSDGGAIAGYVSTPGGEVAVKDILLSDFGGMSRDNAAAAVATLRNAVASAERYKEFARHLSGTERTVRLENNLLSVDVNTRGGVISAAVLKEYDPHLGKPAVQHIRIFLYPCRSFRHLCYNAACPWRRSNMGNTLHPPCRQLRSRHGDSPEQHAVCHSAECG